MPKTVALIQARTSSSRLPGKVLLDIRGQPMLCRVVERVRRASQVDQVIIATTTDPSDDAIVALCNERGYPFFCGNLHDVLDRFYQAACQCQADTIVRITADCPLVDPELIDLTVRTFYGEIPPGIKLTTSKPTTMDCRPPTGGDDNVELFSSEESASSLGLNLYPLSPIPCSSEVSGRQSAGGTFDFAANRLPSPWKRTFPIGLDTEVCSMQALERAWKEAKEIYQREHVMPYLYDDVGSDFQSPSRFKVVLLDWPVDYGWLRWTVDTPPDLELVRAIYARFDGRDDFSWQDVLALVEAEPDFASWNANVRHKTLTEFDERQSLGKRGG